LQALARNCNANATITLTVSACIVDVIENPSCIVAVQCRGLVIGVLAAARIHRYSLTQSLLDPTDRLQSQTVTIQADNHNSDKLMD